MKESNVRVHVRHALERAGFYVDTQTDAIVCPKCGNMIVPPSGKPDLVTTHVSLPSPYVEVKVVRKNDTSLPFDRLSEEQVEWLDNRLKDGFMDYIALGVIRPAGSRSKLESLYLMPWNAWRAGVKIVKLRWEGRKSFPLDCGEDHVACVKCLFGQYRLDPRPWSIPDGHPVRRVPCRMT